MADSKSSWQLQPSCALAAGRGLHCVQVHDPWLRDACARNGGWVKKSAVYKAIIEFRCRCDAAVEKVTCFAYFSLTELAFLGART